MAKKSKEGMTREEFLATLSPEERKQTEEMAKAYDEECAKVAEYLNGRAKAGAARPAAFLALGSFFFAEMFQLAAEKSPEMADMAVQAAMKRGREMGELVMKARAVRSKLEELLRAAKGEAEEAPEGKVVQLYERKEEPKKEGEQAEFAFPQKKAAA